jgi:hypothetical protein
MSQFLRFLAITKHMKVMLLTQRHFLLSTSTIKSSFEAKLTQSSNSCYNILRVHPHVLQPWTLSIQPVKCLIRISFEAFAATEFHEIFSGRQLRQEVKAFWRFGTSSIPSSVCAGGHQFWCYETTSSPWRGDGVSSRNLRKPSHPDAVVCLRKFHLPQMSANAVRLCMSPHLIVIILPISFHFSHKGYAK